VQAGCSCSQKAARTPSKGSLLRLHRLQAGRGVRVVGLGYPRDLVGVGVSSAGDGHPGRRPG
jgi:hypothetical protein